MSMNMYVKRASPAELARLERDGIDPEKVLNGGSDRHHSRPSWLGVVRSFMQPSVRPRAQAPFLRLVGGTQVPPGQPVLPPPQAPPAIPSSSEAGDDAEPLDLQKSWHMLHFVLTGDAWAGAMPAATLLAGGREVGQDLGYGPARIVTERETSAFARHLARLDVPSLARRLDLARMRQLGIYCAESNDLGTLDELSEDLKCFYPELKHYVAEAAGRQQGLVILML